MKDYNTRKAEVPVKSRQALEALPVMALFAIAGKAEATRGAGRWSLDKEKRKRPSSPKSGNGRSAPKGLR